MDENFLCQRKQPSLMILSTSAIGENNIIVYAGLMFKLLKTFDA